MYWDSAACRMIRCSSSSRKPGISTSPAGAGPPEKRCSGLDRDLRRFLGRVISASSLELSSPKMSLIVRWCSLSSSSANDIPSKVNCKLTCRALLKRTCYAHVGPRIGLSIIFTKSLLFAAAGGLADHCTSVCSRIHITYITSYISGFI